MNLTYPLDYVPMAISIAAAAHKKQVDKVGEPYILHPMRVASSMRNDDHDGIATAWLHDVMEDCDSVFAELIHKWMPDHIITAVILLTRTDKFAGDDYYRHLRLDPLARRVKLADIADNMSPERLGQLGEAAQQRLTKKYTHARHVLQWVD